MTNSALTREQLKDFFLDNFNLHPVPHPKFQSVLCFGDFDLLKITEQSVHYAFKPSELEAFSSPNQYLAAVIERLNQGTFYFVDMSDNNEQSIADSSVAIGFQDGSLKIGTYYKNQKTQGKEKSRISFTGSLTTSQTYILNPDDNTPLEN